MNNSCTDWTTFRHRNMQLPYHLFPSNVYCRLPLSSPNLRLGIAAKPTWLPSMGRYPLMPRNFAGATRCRQGLGTGIPAGHDTFHSRTTVQRGILPVDPLDELLLPCYFHFTNHRETEKPLFIICYYLRRICSLLRRRGWLCPELHGYRHDMAAHRIQARAWR